MITKIPCENLMRETFCKSDLRPGMLIVTRLGHQYKLGCDPLNDFSLALCREGSNIPLDRYYECLRSLDTTNYQHDVVAIYAPKRPSLSVSLNVVDHNLIAQINHQIILNRKDVANKLHVDVGCIPLSNADSFLKSDLMPGMLIMTQDETFYKMGYLDGKPCITNEKGHLFLSSYTDDLQYISQTGNVMEKFKITKVYTPNNRKANFELHTAGHTLHPAFRPAVDRCIIEGKLRLRDMPYIIVE